MSTRISTKQKLIGQLESIDSILKDILLIVTKRNQVVNMEPLVELLLEREAKLKSILLEVESQLDMQKKIDVLKADCAASDRQIQMSQLQLKKAEVLLSTALYYSRQKLDSMTKAVKNPVDIEELVRFSHRISAAHGVSAPDNWIQGDPRRPYPNREEIRRGYLGHLDDNGVFRPSLWDALSETASVAANQANVLSSSMNNSFGSVGGPSLAQPTSSGVTSNVDGLSISRSPNMLLPGVNMVSSPITIPQANSGPWCTNAPGNINEPQNMRLPTSSLSVMLESHSRTGAPPPPHLRFPAEGPTGTTPQQMSRSSSGQLRSCGGPPHRTTFSASPGIAPNVHQSQAEVALSPKALARQKRIKRRMEETEMMSSDTCSDSSTDD